MHLQFKSFLSRKCQQTYYQELKKIFFSDLSKSNLFKTKISISSLLIKVPAIISTSVCPNKRKSTSEDMQLHHNNKQLACENVFRATELPNLYVAICPSTLKTNSKLGYIYQVSYGPHSSREIKKSLFMTWNTAPQVDLVCKSEL